MPVPYNIIRRNIQKSRQQLTPGGGFSYGDEERRLDAARLDAYGTAINSIYNQYEEAENPGLLDKISTGWSNLGSSLQNFIYTKNAAEVSNEQERLRINREREGYLNKFNRYMELYEQLLQAGVSDPIGGHIQDSESNAPFKRMQQELRSINEEINNNYSRRTHDFFENKDFRAVNNFDLYRQQTAEELKKTLDDREELEEDLALDMVEKQNALNKINPKFKKYQENALGLHTLIPGVALLELPYIFPEVGSSLQEVKSMAASLAVDFVAGLLTPGGSGSMAALGRFLVRGGALAFNLYNTYQMRKSETNSEAMDALTQRTYEQLSNSQIDYSDVIAKTRYQLERLGVDHSKLDEQDLLSAALAFNIPGSDEYNEILKENKRGLVALKDRNDALAVADYLEVLPFLNYGGKAMRAAEHALIKGTGKLAKKAAPEAFTSYFERRINKFLHPADIEKAVSRTQNIRYLANKAEAMGSVAFKEGLEEGIQGVIQQEYQKGGYDDGYFLDSLQGNAMTNFASSVVADLGLSSLALSAFFGAPLGYDNDEIRKAMITGAASSVLFAGALDAAIGNANTLATGNKGDNLVSLYKQHNVDKQILSRLISEQAANMTDSQHIQTFYNALLNKDGSLNKGKIQYIMDTLDAVKKNVDGEVVTKDFVDDDIIAANVVYNVLSELEKSPRKSHLAKLAKDNEELYGKNTIGRQALVSIAAQSALDVRNTEKGVREASKGINEFVDKLLYAANSEDPSSVEGIMPNDITLINSIQEAYKSYLDDRSNRENERKNKREQLISDLQKNPLRFEQKEVPIQGLISAEPGYVSPERLATLFGESNTFDQLVKKLSDSGVNVNQDDVARLKSAYNAYNNGLLSSRDISAMFDRNGNIQFEDTNDLGVNNELLTKQQFADTYIRQVLRDAERLSRGSILGAMETMADVKNLVEKHLGISLDKMILRGMIGFAKAQLELNPTAIKREQVSKYVKWEDHLSAAAKYANIFNVLDMNDATNRVMQVIDNLIKNGDTDINGLRVIRSMIQDEESNKYLDEFVKLVDQIENLQKDYENMDDSERTAEHRVQLEFHRRNAIKNFINYLVDRKINNNSEERRNITHNQFQDFNPVDSHVSLDEQDRVIAGDQEAEKVAIRKIEQGQQAEKGGEETVKQNGQEEEQPLGQNNEQPEDGGALDRQSEDSGAINSNDISAVDSGALQINPIEEGETLNTAGQQLESVLAIEAGIEDPKKHRNKSDVLDEAEAYINKLPESESDTKSMDRIEEDGASSGDDAVINTDDFGHKRYVTPIAQVGTSEDAYRDYLSKTLFYQLDATNPLMLSAGIEGKPIKTKYKLGTGAELAKMLLNKNWLNDLYKAGNVYYFVSGNTKSTGGKITKDKFGQLTVGILIDDDKSNKTYAIVFKAPEYLNRSSDKMSLRERMRNIGLSEDDRQDLYRHQVQTLLNEYNAQNPREQQHLTEYGNLPRVVTEFFVKHDDIYKQVLEKARRSFNVKGTLSEQEIDDSIKKLTDVRNKIIEKCLIKNGDEYEVRETPYEYKVFPESVEQSNGSIQNKKGQGRFRNLSSVEKLGVSDDVNTLSNQLTSGQVVICIGYGVNGQNENQYAVSSIFTDSIVAGIGYSGTMYIQIEGPGGNPANITLTERRLNIGVQDIRNGGELAFDQDGNLKEGAVPTIAEIALHTMMRSQGNKFFDVLSRFILHYENKTIGRRQSFLKNKQITLTSSGKLKIYMSNPDGKSGAVREFTKDQLDKDLELRRQVILQIADNFHWNTDREDMKGNVPKEIVEYIRKYFKDNPDATECKIFNNSLLTFKKDDFFHKNGRAKNVNQLAWMIHTEKLFTDVTDDVFYAPFVFADGIKGQEVDKQGAGVRQNPATGQAEPESSVQEVKNLKSQIFKNKKTQEEFNAALNSKKSKEEKLDKWNNSVVYWKRLISENEENALQDVILFDLNQNAPYDKLREEINARTARYLVQMKPTHSEEWVKNFESTYNEALDKIMKQRRRNRALLETNMIFMYVSKNGNVELLAEGGATLISKLKETGGVTQVYSEERGRGNLNPTRARKWLAKTLGLQQKDIIVLDAIRSVADEPRYGAMVVSLDSLRGQLEAKINLSKEAGKGVEFHEAWHYVNLLLHGRETREKIYDEFIKYKKLDPNTSNERVEELMAEDFRRYMLLRSGFAKPFMYIYDAVSKLMGLYQNRKLMRKVYKDIRNGKYASVNPGQQALLEFNTKFPNGVYANYYVPGVRQQAVDNMTEITSYDQWYSVAQSLAHAVIDQIATDQARFDKEEAKTLQDKLEEIQKNIELNDVDGNRSKVIKQVLENKDAFNDIILGIMRELGVSPSLETREDANENKTRRETGDMADNLWSVNSYEFSRRANSRALAKFFFSNIPMYERQVTEDEEVHFEPVLDEMLGIQRYWDQDYAWNKILDDMWYAETFDAVDDGGEYMSNSILGIAKRSANIHPFYKAVYEKLQNVITIIDDKEVPDLQLQAQLLTSIKSSFVNTSYVESKSPKNKSTFQVDSGAVMDSGAAFYGGTTGSRSSGINKEFNMHTSDSAMFVRRKTRQWGINAISSGITRQVNGNDKYDVDHIKSIIKRFKDIFTEGNVYFAKRGVNYKVIARKLQNDPERFAEKAQQMTTDLLKLFEEIGITGFNEQCLDAYLSFADNDYANGTTSNGIDDKNLYKIYLLTKLFVRNSKPGSILKILNQLTVDENATGMVVGGRKKAIEDFYYGFKVDSQINLLAKAQIETAPTRDERKVFDPLGSPIYPISLNCELTDKLRHLQNDGGELASKMKRAGYCSYSILLDACKDYAEGNSQYMVQAGLSLGTRDSDTKLGIKFKDLTKEQDYITKMMYMQDEADGKCHTILLPTMSGKSTFFVLRSLGIELPHAYTQDANDIIRSYALSEFQAIKDYYSRSHIEWVIQHRDDLRENYHGNIIKSNSQKPYANSAAVNKFNKRFGAATGNTQQQDQFRMDNSGNGGKFRYFYDILKFDVNGQMLNINEYLDYLYEVQKEIEQNPTKYGGVDGLADSEGANLDGFELVRKGLQEIELRLESLSDFNVNQYFEGLVDLEIKTLEEHFPQIIGRDSNGLIRNTGIPKQILNSVEERTKARVGREIELLYLENVGDPDAPLSEDQEKELQSLTSSEYMHGEQVRIAIADNVLRQMISTIEVEKVITGDPAYYKYDKKGEPREITADYNYSNPNTKSRSVVNSKLKVTQVRDTIADKSKRVGLVLSTGENLHLQYSKEVLEDHPELKSRQYTVSYVNDIKIRSDHYDMLYDKFYKDRIIEYARQNLSDKFDQDTLQLAYVNDDILRKIESSLDENVVLDMKVLATADAKPYSDVNVCDAQTFVRPAMYRRIKIGLGEWSFVEDESGYSDEKAYNIIMEDDSWMSDPEKYKLVAKLQVQPLKMVYFQNTPESLGVDGEQIVANIPATNKQAVFPLFKFQARSSVGQKLYERMNQDGNEIDMVIFESAVKVGLTKEKYKFYSGETNDFNTDKDFNNAWQNQKSTSTIQSESGLPSTHVEDGKLVVKLQDIDGLRLQLNTHAHEADSRSVGTQMLKQICGDIVDEYKYGEKTGRQIRNEVSDLVKKISDLGASRAQQKMTGSGFRTWMNRVLKGLGIGVVQSSLLFNGLEPDGISSRIAFQKSIATYVAENTIDIVTFGGSAIQQSVFGLVGGAGKNGAYNNGEDLQLVDKNNSTEIMLSLNFFRHIIPNKFKTDYATQRQWLIENDYIKGTKSDGTQSNPKPIGVGYRIPTQGMSSMFAFTVADVLPEHYGDCIIVPKEFTAQTGSDFDVDKIYIAIKSQNKPISEKAKNGLREDEKQNIELRSLQDQLIDNYITVLTDEKNIAITRSSIDVVTNKIKKEIVPVAQDKKSGYVNSGEAILASSQCLLKQRFLTGKRGVSAMALNITHQALSQWGKYSIDIDKKYLYKHDQKEQRTKDQIFTPFYDMYGIDGIRKSAWLSAMVNAHVDVEKDPYIFDLNVNPITYDVTCLLLRLGQGENTFYFLMQDVVKKYVQALQERDNNTQYTTFQESDYDVAKRVLGISDDSITAQLHPEVLTNAKSDSINKIDDKEHRIKCIQTYLWLKNKSTQMQKAVQLMRGSEQAFGKTCTEIYEFENKIEEQAYDSAKGKTVINSLGKFMFEDSFIGRLFYNYEETFKMIAHKHFVDASPEFEKLYKNIMSMLLGKKYATGTTYKSLPAQDSLRIANRIVSVYRHYLMQRSQGDPVSSQKTFAQIEKENDYRGSIDVMCGGNIDSIRNHMYTLMYGIEGVALPLATRFANFKQKLSQQSYDGDTNGILDYVTGVISNHFINLLYIRPESQDVPFDRIGMSKATPNMTELEKSQISSALSVLLMHEDPQVRRLARDIVFYNYHTTYNTNTRNSIFDLVPPEFRQKYADDLKSVLQADEALDENFINNVADIVVRNYWDDDRLAPSIVGAKASGSSSNNMHVVNRDFGVVATTKFNSAYIKDGSYLYKLVGYADRTSGVHFRKNKKGGKNEQTAKRVYIYKAIPKLGLISSDQRFVEFYNDGSTESLFGANNMPKQFSEPLDKSLQRIFDSVEYKFGLFEQEISLDKFIPLANYVEQYSYNTVGNSVIVTDLNYGAYYHATINESKTGDNLSKNKQRIDAANVIWAHPGIGSISGAIKFWKNYNEVINSEGLEAALNKAIQDAKEQGKKLVVDVVDALVKFPDKFDLIIQAPAEVYLDNAKDYGKKKAIKQSNKDKIDKAIASLSEEDRQQKVITVNQNLYQIVNYKYNNADEFIQAYNDNPNKGNLRMYFTADVEDYLNGQTTQDQLESFKREKTEEILGNLSTSDVEENPQYNEVLQRLQYLNDNLQYLYAINKIKEQVLQSLNNIDNSFVNQGNGNVGYIDMYLAVDGRSSGYEGICAAIDEYAQQKQERGEGSVDSYVVINTGQDINDVKNKVAQSTEILSTQQIEANDVVDNVIQEVEDKQNELIDNLANEAQEESNSDSAEDVTNVGDSTIAGSPSDIEAEPEIGLGQINLSELYNVISESPISNEDELQDGQEDPSQSC